MEIFKLFGSVFIDNEKANKQIDDTDAKGKGLAGTLKSTIGTAAKFGVGLAAGAGVAVGGMLALANKTAEAADEIDKLSERTGINREELQRWKYAAGQSGADVGKLEVGIKKLSDQMDGAVSGNKAATEAFGKLGISMDDLKNKSQEDIFSSVMNALGDMEQGAARNALGNDLLGKSYTEMLPLLNAGSEGMKGLKDRADELGLVMSEDAVKANVKFGDTMADVKDAVGAVFMHISNIGLPILQQFLDWILMYMPQIQAVFQVVFSVISALATGFITVIQKIIEWIRKWADANSIQLAQIKSLFMVFFQAVQEFISAFVEFATALWTEYGDTIMAVVSFAFDYIAKAIQIALTLVTDIFKIFAALFRGDWEGLWEGIKKYFLDVWNGMYTGLKGTINLIIRAINWMVEQLNKISFSIPDWVPELGGKSWGFSLPKIPELAEGGDILRRGMALVGEAGPELLELPEGARVSPLKKAGGLTVNVINRGSIVGSNGMNELADIISSKIASKYGFSTGGAW